MGFAIALAVGVSGDYKISLLHCLSNNSYSICNTARTIKWIMQTETALFG